MVGPGPQPEGLVRFPQATLDLSTLVRSAAGLRQPSGLTKQLFDLLLPDDWGLQGFSAEGRRDLLEIAEQRHGRKSIPIASQTPVEK